MIFPGGKQFGLEGKQGSVDRAGLFWLTSLKAIKKALKGCFVGCWIFIYGIWAGRGDCHNTGSVQRNSEGMGSTGKVGKMAVVGLN